MFAVFEEALAIQVEQLGMPFDDQQVFRVLMLRLVCEVEAARDERGLVDNDDFVVRDGMIVVDFDVHALLQKNM